MKCFTVFTSLLADLNALKVYMPASLSFIKEVVRKLPRKKSRARVSIKGHCVLLQNSPRTKMFDFFQNRQNYRMSHIFLDILLNP